MPDTQETIEHSKRHVAKLRFEPSGLLLFEREEESNKLAAAFCGAGSGPLIDKLVEGAWEAAQSATSLDEACVSIEVSIRAAYAEFGQIYQPGFCPQVDLIYGVKMHDGSRLFSASGPIINEKQDYYSSGSGY